MLSNSGQGTRAERGMKFQGNMGAEDEDDDEGIENDEGEEEDDDDDVSDDLWGIWMKVCVLDDVEESPSSADSIEQI